MISIKRSYKIAKNAYFAFENDDGFAMAGYIAFSGMLAIFPFLIFAVGLTGLLIGPEQSEAAVDSLFVYAPNHVAQTLEPVLREVLQARGQAFITFSILITIWVASNIFESIRVAFDRAYDVRKKRHYVVRRLIAIAFVFVGAIVAVVLGISIIFMPIVLSYPYDLIGYEITNGAAILSFILGLLTFVIFLLLMHRFLPARDLKNRRIWPGVLVSVVLWVTIALGFSLYLSYAPSYAITYGTLTGVIVTLLFFYLTGVSIIFGAEVNAEINASNEHAD